MRRECFIEQLARQYDWRMGAELGVWRGRTFLHLLRSCPHLTLIGVDKYMPQPENQGPEKWTPGEHGHPWDHEANYQSVLCRSKSFGARAVLIKDWTHEAVKSIPDCTLDFVFIDADHSEVAVRQDISLWMQKIGDEGWMLGHDITWPGVRRAVDSLVPGWERGAESIWLRPKVPR